jgi:hypothetical protein
MTAVGMRCVIDWLERVQLGCSADNDYCDRSPLVEDKD